MTEIENETERNRQRIIRNYAQGYAGESDEEERKFIYFLLKSVLKDTLIRKVLTKIQDIVYDRLAFFESS